jgi:SPX domain protein involved in polyphosphate accumulation
MGIDSVEDIASGMASVAFESVSSSEGDSTPTEVKATPRISNKASRISISEWVNILSAELSRVVAFRDRKMDEEEERLQTFTETLLEEVGKETTKKSVVETSTTLSTYERVVKLSERNEALKDFGVVNETAFIKIWKKYEKKLLSHLTAESERESVMSELASAKDKFMALVREQVRYCLVVCYMHPL